MIGEDSHSTIYDVTRTISVALAGWPGDTPYQFTMLCHLRSGASVNLGSLQMSPHTGTHIDAPFHFTDAGPSAADLALDSYLGPAWVCDVRGRSIITRDDIGAAASASPRLLLRTGGWSDSAVFPGQIPVLAPDVPEWLRGKGVVLLGVDVPSVDQIDSKELPNHHALGRCGIAILEGLDLQKPPDGAYELIALPLRLFGADGSPVRAILRAHPSR